MLLKFKDAWINSDYIEAITRVQGSKWMIRMHKSDDFELDCSDLELSKIINKTTEVPDGTRKLSI